MLPKQQAFFDYLKGMEQVIAPFSDGDHTIYAPETLAELQKSVAEQELIVPVVGGFSSGKSTLINAFLSDPYLPVAITPETSLAAELHYAESAAQERLELVDRAGHVETLSKDRFDVVKEKAGDSKLVRVYLHEHVLRKIEPLILVDMPGFESPLDLHNEAIFTYIEKGVSYIVLTSIEDGTVSRSMVRQLADIRNVNGRDSFQRDVSFYLSKANLRSPGDVEKVKAHIEAQLEEQLDLKASVVPIGEDGGRELKKVLDSIDPNRLFTNIFQPTLRGVFNDIIDTIDVTLSALRKDSKANEASLQELAESKAKIEKKRAQALAEAESRYSHSSVDSIVHYVGSQLSSALDELTAAAKQGGEALSQRVSEITRSALIAKTGEVLERITDDLAEDFSVELGSLNQQMGDSFVGKLGDLTTYADRIKAKILAAMKHPPVVQNGGRATNIGTTAKTIVRSIAFAALGIGQILIGALIVFLPEIIGFFTQKAKEAKQNEAIRQQILTVIIPDVKRKLSGELKVHFTQQVKSVIEQVSAQFSQQIAQHEESIRKAQEEYDQHRERIETRVAAYESLKTEIETMSKPVLFA